jgi:alpha-L-arabinofuranosidase
MACQFNSGELCPVDELGPYIQDALDLVEFANGDTNTVWGAKRAALGHPAPFHLKLLGVGNEQWGQQYIDRYALFAKALKEKYPDLQLISAAGPSPDDDRFKFAWPKLRALHADLIDEHCYAKPDWFFANTHRYDAYDRNGPKVFMGEYAAQSSYTVSVKNRNNLESALAEAAYLTGLERNGDVVRMASYAPLFANIDAWQWTPDLIWVDSLEIYRTPNYYVQQLYSLNHGDVVLPVKLDSAPGAKLFASATRDEASGEIILKVVNGESTAAAVQLDLAGMGKISLTEKIIVLAGEPGDANSFAEPQKVSPKEDVLEIPGADFSHEFPANSFTVLRLKPE